MGVQSISIQNFKSIRQLSHFELGPINVLIGPNGSGKSNFISFFKFLNQIYQKSLRLYVSKNGGAADFLYFGLKKSDCLAGSITFDNEFHNEYKFKLAPNRRGHFIFEEEESNHHKTGDDKSIETAR